MTQTKPPPEETPMHLSNQQTTLMYPISRSPWRRGIFLISLACFALSQAARAVDPPPGGGYANDNTAVGEDALFSLTTGIRNTATGYEALYSNTTGRLNTAIGWEAMTENTTGERNTAVGCDALDDNTAGSLNTALGVSALHKNTTGNNNTSVGRNAMGSNTTGSFNIALGDNAGSRLTTGTNNIDIGNSGVAGESDTMRIGTNGIHLNAFMAGIFGVTVPNGVGVIVDTTGRLGVVVSSARFKDEIRPMDKKSEAILALKPVTFHYKHELDPAGIPQFGLVAEEVEKVNPDLVARDEQGKPYTVRYEAVNAMLLNEFLKEHCKVEEQGAMMAEQQKQIQALTAMVKEQAAQIQKVSDQLTASKPPARIVADN